MGVGNFYLENAETIYIDHEAIYGPYLVDEDRFEDIEHDFDYQLRYEDLIDSLTSLLSPTYDVEPSSVWRHEGRMIAENNFYEIVIVDWQSYFAVNVVLKDDDDYERGVHPLAEANHAKAATAFFDRIAAIYPDHVRQRSSAWTSSRYITNAA
jgi:hypothetical protein